MLKVAQYAAQLEQYDKAIQIYESVSCHLLCGGKMQDEDNTSSFRWLPRR